METAPVVFAPKDLLHVFLGRQTLFMRYLKVPGLISALLIPRLLTDATETPEIR